MPDRQSFFADEPAPSTPAILSPGQGESFFAADPDDALTQAMRLAPNTTPDDAARVLRLQQRTGLPADVIARHLDEVEAEAAARTFNADTFRRTSPTLAGWLAERPEHAALAQDDLIPLTALERSLDVGRNVAGAYGAGWMGFSQGVWGLIQEGAELTGATGVGEFARGSAQIAGQLGARARGRQARAGFVERSIYGGVESVGQMTPGLVAGAFGGAPALLGVAGATTQGQAYSEARAQGLGVGDAARYGGLQGGIEIATEFLPGSRLLADLARRAPWWKTLVRQLTSEIPGEQVATILQDLTSWAMLPENRERPFQDYLAERPSAAAATLISTITAVGATTSATTAAARVLDRLSGAARTSTTLQRSPDSVGELVERATAGTPASTVHLPIDTFTEYFQSKGEDPAARAAAITGDPQAFARARQTGEDLAVPMRRYVTEVAGTEHGSFFAQEARFDPHGPNAREQRALSAQVDTALSAATTAAPEPVAPAAEIGARVRAMLESAGVEASTATVNASIVEQQFATLGARFGVDPVALFARYNLTVSREGFDAPLEPFAEGDEIRALEQRVPAGATPEARLEALTPVEAPGLPADARRVPFPVIGDDEALRLWQASDRSASRLETVPVHQIVATQQTFTPTRVRELLAGEAAEAPTAMVYRGRYYLAGGHHRAIAAWARGADRLELRVVDVDAARLPASGIRATSAIDESGRELLGPEGFVGAEPTRATRTAGTQEADAQLEALRRPRLIEALPSELMPRVRTRELFQGEQDPTLPDAGERFAAIADRRTREEREDLAALEALIAQYAGPEPQFVDVGGLEVNASGESVASLEAQRRLEGMRARGETFAVRDRAGRVRPLIGPDAVDYRPRPGETFGIQAREGFRVLGQVKRGVIRFKGREFHIELLKRADLSTFLHEWAHFSLEVMGDLVDELATRDPATVTDTQRQLQADYQTLLASFGVATRAEIGDEHHEAFARLFEAYLLEGRAPSAELRPVFARIRAWLVSLYKSIRALRVQLTPEVRDVLDRLLATDTAIAVAAEDLEAGPLFTDDMALEAGLTPAERTAMRAAIEAASEQARDALSRKVLGELQRERERWWRRERAAIARELAPEIAERPVYRALALLQRGTHPDGSPLPAGVEAFKLSADALVEQFGADILRRLPRPRVHEKAGKGGVLPSVAAELLGYPSSDALVEALTTAPPLEDAVEAAADAEMRRRHGDVLLDGRLLEEAERAVLEESSELFVAQARAIERLLTRRGQRPRTPTLSVATVRELAERRIAGTAIGGLRPAVFAAAARRAGRQAREAAGRQDFAGALRSLQQQLLNAELHRAAAAARDLVETARQTFREDLLRSDAALADRYNLDLVNAARALLGQFQLAPAAVGFTALQYLERIRTFDVELHADLQAAVDVAGLEAKPFRELTVDEFVAVRDGVLNLWHLARRTRQLVVEGRQRELADVRAELQARLRAIAPAGQRRYTRAVTKWQETKQGLLGWRSALRRVESWVDAIDSGDPEGTFRRVLFTPISEAASTYRVAKRQVLERYLAIVKGVERSLTPHDIAAPELDYTFTGKIELLHALLHTGNDSNLSKLLRGRGWGEQLAPEAPLDTSRWDAFIARMWAQGVLTKADMDYVQAVWDLNEELKPEAWRVHHDLYGYLPNEVTARPVQTPVGTYRGGYMPAIVDPLLAEDASRRADRAAVEQTPNSFMFPSTGRGFTKARVEVYAGPLALNLRLVPAHLDQVLRFIHLQPAVKNAGRLLIDKSFRTSLHAFDPTVAGELLVPWVQRAARQTVETPSQGRGGRLADRFFRGLRRRTGMQVMVGNVLNTLQQVTGFGPASLKVPKRDLARALWRYVRGPGALAALIAEKSAFMATRTTASTIEIQTTIDDLLLNPSTYEKARAFAAQHGYFLQQATQNVVDLVTWSGAYDRAVAEGAREIEAVRRADSAVRLTQGSFNPEDLSRFETGSAFARAFTMFYSYWNGLANTLGTEVQVTVRELGLTRGAGRLLHIYVFGFLSVALLGDAIVRFGSGDDWDQDDDGDVELDDALAWFFGAQARAATAMVPGIGLVVNAGLNTLNDKWYDDRISVSPIVTALESAVRGATVAPYRAITEGELRRRDVRDVLTLLGLLSGTPTGALARPLGYAAAVASGEEEPESVVDATRGAIVGR